MGGRRMFIHDLGALKMQKRVCLFFLTVCCPFLGGGWAVGVVNTSLILKKKYSRREIFFPLPCRVLLNYFSWPSQLTSCLSTQSSSFVLGRGWGAGLKLRRQETRAAKEDLRRCLRTAEPRALGSWAQSCAGQGASSPWEPGRGRQTQTDREKD